MIFTKVIYLGNFEPYYTTENYVAYALEQKGIEVVRCSAKETSYTDFQRVIKANRDVDFVLFAKSASIYTVSIINYLKSQNVLSVCWCWDLFFGYGRCLTNTFRADLVITTDGGHTEEWKKRNINHYVIRQGIHKPDALQVSLPPQKFYWPIVFVGSTAKHTAERNQLVDWLKSTYKKDFRQVTTKRGLHLNQLLSQTKIVIGDSVDSPNYWSNRIYEITGRGGFLLNPATEGLTKEFTSGEHIGTYARGNFDDLAFKIDYYLNDSNVRERIREAGYKHCLSNFTYENRVTELLSLIRNYQQLQKVNQTASK